MFNLDETILKALESALSPTEVLVFRILAERAGEDDLCHITVRELSEIAGKSQISVRKATASLKDKGCLAIIPQKGKDGSTKANTYRVYIDLDLLQELHFEKSRPRERQPRGTGKPKRKVSKTMDNWGSSENETMKGYLIFALEILKEERPEITDEDIQSVLLKINRATDTLTADEAHKYYLNSQFL